ncbi:MAG: ATP-binding protein [Promethearchaeota archaeon]
MKKEELIKLSYPTKNLAGKGDINVGTILYGNKKRYNYYIRLEDLARHMFITGITGSGKSNFFQNFLINYTKKYGTPFLLAEFKGEYHYLQKKIPNLLVFIVGKNFAINIFDPEGQDSEVHAERVFQIFRSGGLFEGVEYTPQMERVFTDILKRVCEDPAKRKWKAFYEESEIYYAEIYKETRDPTFKSSVTAVTNRIRRYSLGTLKHSFETKMGLDVKEIFKHNILLDVSGIIKIGGEKEDTLFFLNMLFKYLWDKNIEMGSKEYKGIRHITIIEDAQYFASQSTTKRSTISSYIEDIALLLRGTGECLISLATRPAVSPEILANCGILVSFQNHMQKDYLQDLLNFEDKERKFLSLLGVGKCMIRVNSIGKPFALKVPFIKREWLSEEEIEKNNKEILERIHNETGQEIMQEVIESPQEQPEIVDMTTDTTLFCHFCGNEILGDIVRCDVCNTTINRT